MGAAGRRPQRWPGASVAHPNLARAFPPLCAKSESDALCSARSQPYFWNTQTQQVSWTPPGPTLPSVKALPAPPPASALGSPRAGPGAGAVGASVRDQVFSDPQYQNLINQKGRDVAGLQRGLSNLDSAVRLPGSAPAPGMGYGGPPPTLPPPGGLPPSGPPPSGPPPSGPPPSGGPPPAASGGGGGGRGGGGGGGGGGGKGGSVTDKWGTPTQHRLRAMPHYARNVGLCSSATWVWVGMIMMGNGEYLGDVNKEDSINGGTVTFDNPHGTYLMLCLFFGGALMFAFECNTFMREQVLVMPWLWQVRVVLYLGLSAPGFYTASETNLMPPLICSTFYLFTGLLNLAACLSMLPKEKEWAWKWLPDSKKKDDEQGGKPPPTFGEFVGQLPRMLLIEPFQKNQLPRRIFLLWYAALNLVLYVEAYYRHKETEKGRALRGVDFLACGTPPKPCVDPDDPDGVRVPENQLLIDVGAGVAYPFAKGFGQLLNLNCAVMILPVFRKGVRKLHDLSSMKGSPFWWIPYVLPLDKNIVFHKACAKYFIFVSVVGHCTAHYVNYAKAPFYEKALGAANYDANALRMGWDPTAPGAGASGVSAGFTGQLLLIVMIIIYPAAHDKVKRSHYETFWYSHHFFVAWFLLLLLHGPIWWVWALLTLVPYAADRVLRVFHRGKQRVALARVYFWGKPDRPDVVTLQFDNAFDDKGVKPVQYMEGHYLYLCCPAVETSSWNGFEEYHPFTISSAPDEPVLEVNIRVMPCEYSWTNKVSRYLQLLDPNQSGEVELATRNPTTGVTTLGKVIGPDGKPFFRVDAPHGAPSQHVFQYRTVMLVGAGIGVTPCASIMKGVVNYRWKKGFIPNNLHFFWVARISDLTTFKWLLVMLPELKAQQLVHNEYYGGDEGQQKMLRARASELAATRNDSPATSTALPPGWAQTAAPDGRAYWYNSATGATSWTPPAGGVVQNSRSSDVELVQVQNQLKAASTNSRTLAITLYLTGCKPEQLKPEGTPKPGSTEEMIRALQATRDPATGEPYLTLKAGRPKWDKEFQDLGTQYGREDIGVVFCGAPMIAEALKEQCEKQSDKDRTVFRLHKENF